MLRIGFLLNAYQQGAFANPVAGFYLNLFHFPGRGGYQAVVHLHGVKYHQHIALLNLLTLFNLYINNGSGYKGRNVLIVEFWMYHSYKFFSLQKDCWVD